MTSFILLALFTIAGQQIAPAAPVTATGSAALALAAVIAQHSPLLRPFDERVIAHCSVDAQILALRPIRKSAL
jgi:hypothetical protein